MNSRIVKIICLFVFLMVSFTACSGEGGKSMKKSESELKFEAKIADLVKNNKDLNKEGDRGIPMLNWAIEHNYVDSVKMLLENGADPDVLSERIPYETPLFGTATKLSYADDKFETEQNERSRAIAEILINAGADVNHLSTKIENTPLHEAAAKGRADLCDLFIQNGATVHAPDVLGNTPLHEAAKGGYWEAAKVLLENGADATYEDKLGHTPMSWAEKRTDEEAKREISKKSGLKYNPNLDYDKTIEILQEHGA